MRTIYTLALAIAGIILWLGASNGPAAVQGADRTGSPVTSGTCANAGCHAAGAFSPAINLVMLDDGTAVTSYIPGRTYTMRLTINTAMAAPVYGFQSVALRSGNAQAGSFTAGTGSRVTTLNNRQYVEHSQRSTSNIFEVTWTAPATDQGEVRVYASAVAANNIGGPAGDGSATLASPLVLTPMVSSSNDLPQLATELRAFPNPAADWLQVGITMAQATHAQIRLVSLQGQTLLQQQSVLLPGQNDLRLDVGQLPAGYYTLEVTDGKATSTKRILKR